MPGLVRKILIFAAVDGLILQPISQRGQRPATASKIIYKDRTIEPILKDGGEVEEDGKSFEAFGIVGLLTVSKSSFLISITRRQQVAQIRGKAVYVITEVALTPLTSRSEAELSIAHTCKELKKGRLDSNGDAMGHSDTDDDEEELSAALSDDVDDYEIQSPVADTTSPPLSSGQMEHKRTTSIAEDVFTRKGSYGRFAQKWFSKSGWTAGQRQHLGMSSSASETDAPKPLPESQTKQESFEKASVVDAAKVEDITELKSDDGAANILPKLLRTTQILFGSKNFFFSYDYDVTRSFATRRTTNSELPLYKEVDPLFFWNRNVIQPFIDAGQTLLVLPLMQGFIGQIDFTVDPDPPLLVDDLDGCAKSSLEMVELSPGSNKGGADNPDAVRPASPSGQSSSDTKAKKPYLLTLISRRSVKRAGLRYLRRGVDEEGHTANSIETEQILSDPEWTKSSKIYSFVQIRGSIPVFFTQTPYSFKPIPQIQHSPETNFQAFKKHFYNISARYGSIHAASLVEKHEPEAIVGEAYVTNMNALNKSGGINGILIGLEWFDFHAVCRGMHFENVSLLINLLQKKLYSFGHSVEVDGKLLSKQSGVLRTNCMDCLDRTNVVQSAVGRQALEIQLQDEGIDLNLQADQTWFNSLWASNGDAISKQYASTAALKGDYTRTGKRNVKGALTDLSLTISRFYSGIVNDYFSQAAIDFLVGNVTSLVFEDFEENMMSGDPAISMQKLRQQAIDVSQKLVVADDHEELIGGWTLLTPQIPNTVKSMPFEESVLLLTDAALYACRWNWETEKVSSFERVDLSHILTIKYGTYITSTLSAAQADPDRNVGFVINYAVGTADITRVNTRSLSSVQYRSEKDLSGGSPVSPRVTGLVGLIGGRLPAAPNRVLAFKALPAKSSFTDDAPRVSEIEQIKTICSEVERMALLSQIVESGTERKKDLIKHGDIISLAEARKGTGILEQLGHSLKKMVWA